MRAGLHYPEIFTGCRARLCGAATILALCRYDGIETFAARMGACTAAFITVHGAAVWRPSLCAGRPARFGCGLCDVTCHCVG